jgi:hypothetical protein
MLPPPWIPTTLDVARQILGVAGAQTASFDSTAYDMGGVTEQPPFPLNPPMGAWVAMLVIPITSYKTSAGNEEYQITVQDSPDNGSGAPTGAWRNWSRTAILGENATETPAQPGFVAIPLLAVNEWLRIAVTISGTAPTITFGTPYVMTRLNNL